MDAISELKANFEKLSVVGLGYVGLPLAIEFSKVFNVVGFDINEGKILNYNNGIDVTNEVGNDAIKQTSCTFTSDEDYLKECKVHIVSVPTPINSDKTPNLNPVIEATKIVGRNMKKGSVIVYESTVYPGTTEEICVPILEKISGLKFNIDFHIGYSPERINPGDKVNTLTKIKKVVSGSSGEILEFVAQMYESIIEAGVHRAENIKVAEASKIVENSQRDINIAFMNELSMVFNRMEIDTSAVLEAAGTKWNFMRFTPGLVGGHCIGVDPYYFIYKAEQLGYHSQIILSGRKINDSMGAYVANNVIKCIIKNDKNVKGARVAILGVTFKENVADVRNSKVFDVVNELLDYGVEVLVCDPKANKEEVYNEYNLNLQEFGELKDIDVVIAAVNHDEYKELNIDSFIELFKEGKPILFDLKKAYEKNDYIDRGFDYWSL
ncbi:UDP-N-acetyl-D-galactosamine dehydrogenase [Pontibacillus halophilus JSM 076056 = DSM 19796]|uniref:UDP-N-acetyl-D-galactosamine dehydrogenase n=1 Tax=Pontibacillus halophilus JSM 076056 = DSM 19796 TaxID=1385510 RepID=A0A0A5G9X2_9BACI|nr:nucleotide sugar dehydrogenase [Pontibacillus halophilus]KGX89961.1 UDP-N-acetyl-D-galactosamine dehydrogenase [Pontibacillus halophilus JSM 076056 = DSM 19796]